MKITNDSSSNMYLLAWVAGDELSSFKNESEYEIGNLMTMYEEQDLDPHYVPDRVPSQRVKYIERYELYEQLLKQGYPYIMKLPAGKSCIMYWGSKGFELLD